MTSKSSNLNQTLDELPVSSSFDQDVLQKRTLLVGKIGQLLNGQGETLYLNPEQSSLLNRQLLVSATQLNVVGVNGDAEDIAKSEAERILAGVIEGNLD